MTTSEPCRCGHDRTAHEHFRPGSDCGACGPRSCARYAPARPVRPVLAATLIAALAWTRVSR
jgi:hypothetical protein